MDRFRGLTFSTAWFLFLFFMTIFCPQALSSGNVAEGDGGQNNVKTNTNGSPSALAMLMDTVSTVLSRSPVGTWNKVKSFLNQMQLHFFPPDLDFRSRDLAQTRMGAGDGAGGRMKEAAEESAKSAVAAVEESAKSAAKVVGDAVQMTADKVKETVSTNQESNAEL